MLEEIDLGLSNDRVVAYKWEGAFDLAGFEQAKIQFLPELKMRDRLNIFIDVIRIDKIEAQAVWKDLKLAVENHNEFSDKIDRIAIVTNVSWLKNMANASAIVYSKIQIKTFEVQEREKAVRWIDERSHIL